MKVFARLVLMLAVANATASAAELTTRDGRPLRHVAVISRLSDTIVLYHAEPSVPVTVWRGDVRSFLVPDFAIDARIEKSIASAIAPLFTVVDLAAGAADVNYADWEPGNVGNKIRNLPQRADIDAYIVVCQDKHSVEMGSFLTTRGLVLYERWRMIGRNLVGLLGFYRVMIVDAHTGETIAEGEGGIETDIFQSSIARKEIDNSFWPGENSLPPADQVPALREEFYKFVDESLLWTLKDMDLAH